MVERRIGKVLVHHQDRNYFHCRQQGFTLNLTGTNTGFRSREFYLKFLKNLALIKMDLYISVS